MSWDSDALRKPSHVSYINVVRNWFGLIFERRLKDTDKMICSMVHSLGSNVLNKRLKEAKSRCRWRLAVRVRELEPEKWKRNRDTIQGCHKNEHDCRQNVKKDAMRKITTELLTRWSRIKEEKGNVSGSFDRGHNGAEWVSPNGNGRGDLQEASTGSSSGTGLQGEAEINSAQHHVCYMAFFVVELRQAGRRNFKKFVTSRTKEGGHAAYICVMGNNSSENFVFHI